MPFKSQTIENFYKLSSFINKSQIPFYLVETNYLIHII